MKKNLQKLRCGPEGICANSARDNQPGSWKISRPMKALVSFCALSLAFGLVAKADDSTPKKEDAKPAPKTETKPAVADLTDPSKLTEKAPDSFKVRFDTTKGAFTAEVTRSLAPTGADRFYSMLRS